MSVAKTIMIGYDPRAEEAYNACVNSLVTNTTDQLDIIPVLTNLQETAKLTTSALATTGLKVNTLCYALDI